MRRLYTQLLTRNSVHILSWSLLCAVLLGSTQLRAQSINLGCNTFTSLTATAPASASLSVETSEFGFPAINSYTNANNLIDANRTNVASKNILAVAGEHWIEVRNGSTTPYPGGSFAGFVVDFSDLSAYFIQQRTLSTVTIRVTTYLNNTQQDTYTNSSLLFSNIDNVNPLTDKALVGFVSNTAKPYNRIRFTLNGVTATDMDLYYAVVKNFCTNNSDLACNAPTILNETLYPVAIDMTNTGVTGLCLACTVANPENVIDASSGTAATISSIASLSGTASIAVKNQLQDYPANTFAGFDIQTLTVASADLLSSITITLYNNGSAVQTSTNNTLLLGTSATVAGNTRQVIGIVSTATFDEAKISFSSIAGVDLGVTLVYSTIIKRFCAGVALSCPSSITAITNPNFPVYINSANTGIGSLGCAGCTFSNSENVVDGSATTPATIVLNASAASSAQLSVANAIDTYPAETFAGFEIGSSTLANLNLAGSVRITLYNNGSAVQSGAGTNLLAGATLLSGDRQIVGTVAQVPFDEIQIEFNQLGSVNPLGTISIYRAVVQRACVTAVVCNQTRYLTAPDFSAVVEGTRTGFSGAASIGSSSIQDPWNVVSASKTDFARIINVAGGVIQASISVADPADVYPAGTFAGFTIAKGTFLVSADLLQNLTVTTYLNGIEQESKSGSTALLDLTVFVQLFGIASNFYNVGFATTKPFDEIRLSVRSFASVLQIVDVYGAFVDTRFSSDGGTLVCNFVLNPDFNVTTKNVPVSGNVSTNDKVPSGTTYDTPAPAAGNPSGATIILNSTGTYSFTATTPGTYTYTVPVCASGQTTCPITPLIITVLDATVTTNKPVANPDYASVQSSTATAGSVTVNVRANDGPGNVGGTLGTPTITTAPTHGTATMNGSGNVIYTPATGYVGDDILTYQVCENPGGLCATAQVTIHVVAPGSSTVSVDDDYVNTGPNMSVSGNVLTNDIGNGLTVSNPNTTVTSSGTLVISATGSYTFTPAPGATGPVDFTYTACDNSATAVCGTATLHVLIIPIPDLFPVIYVRPSTVYNTTDITVVVDVVELNSIATNGQITVKLTRDTRVSLSFSTTATSVNDRMVQNSSWNFNDSDPNYYVLTTNQSVGAGDKLSFGLTGTLTPGATSGILTTSAVLTGNSGGEAKINNNADADKVDYFQQ